MYQTTSVARYPDGFSDQQKVLGEGMTCKRTRDYNELREEGEKDRNSASTKLVIWEINRTALRNRWSGIDALVSQLVDGVLDLSSAKASLAHEDLTLGPLEEPYPPETKDPWLLASCHPICNPRA